MAPLAVGNGSLVSCGRTPARLDRPFCTVASAEFASPIAPPSRADAWLAVPAAAPCVALVSDDRFRRPREVGGLIPQSGRKSRNAYAPGEKKSVPEAERPR